MSANKIIVIPPEVTPGNIEDVMNQAITLELATIPTYLSTYYSINRAQDQDALYNKLIAQLSKSSSLTPDEVAAKAQELKLDILVYANKAAALTMSVVIEEMLHLALSSNVKQMVCQSAPDLVEIGKALIFPTQLDGHMPEFIINAGPLSLDQLTTFLQIESPNPFTDANAEDLKAAPVDYQTIGGLYNLIEDCIRDNFPGPYKTRPQLLPPHKKDPSAKPRPFYSQNSMNTVYYDRDHNPQFINQDDSGELVGVHDGPSAIHALKLICDQGEGNRATDLPYHEYKLGPDGMPLPMEVTVDKNGVAKAQFLPGDYDDNSGTELTHYAKFLEAYSLGRYYKQKFEGMPELDEFFSYFVYDQQINPKQAIYNSTGNDALALANELGSAVFTYILLLVETCYYKEEDTQYELFMYGVHKSMIWLLSGVGNHMKEYSYTYEGKTYQGALSFEPYDFSKSSKRPKAQILDILHNLATVDSYWTKSPGGWTDNYFPSLPDVGLDHSVVENVPSVEQTPYSS